MPRYRVTERSYINDRIVEAGEEVDFDGIPSYNLELVDKAETAKVKAQSEKSLRAEAKKIGAKLLVPGPAGTEPTWRDLTDEDDAEVVAKAIMDTKQLRTD